MKLQKIRGSVKKKPKKMGSLMQTLRESHHSLTNKLGFLIGEKDWALGRDVRNNLLRSFENVLYFSKRW